MARAFGPLDRPPTGTVNLRVEEFEALRLSDFEGLDQEKAAAMMGISRKSYWIDLRNAREKLTRALVEGLVVEIEGGSYVVRETPSWRRRVEE